MNRAVISILLFLAAQCASAQDGGSELLETKLSKVVHSHFSLPYALVPDAGKGASKLSDKPLEQWQYLDSYAKGAKDALIQESESDADYVENSELCKAPPARQVKLLSCGYVDGYDAVKKRRAAVTMQDFGYVRRAEYGEVLLDSQSELKVFQVRGQPSWFLGYSSKLPMLEVGECYAIVGYLSPDGGFGGRFRRYSREFIALSVTKAGSPCVDPRLLDP
jgi:hypothetical protein